MIASIFLLGFFYWFELMGLACFVCAATLVCNMQVLKTSSFWGLSHPLPLGTALFSCIFLVIDLCLEIYGRGKTQQIVILSFCVLFFWNVFALMTLWFVPAPESIEFHRSMKFLFEPGPRLFIASVVAYATAVFAEIVIFSTLGNFFGGKYLWLRANISSWISCSLDGFLFSFLAWNVFSPSPLPIHTILFTYTFGAWIARVMASFFGTPALYIALYIHRKRRDA